MANDISLIDGVLILNGVEITGFGDSETAIDFPNQDILAVRRGAGGGMIGGKTGNFGGPLTLSLLQNSKGFKFLMSVKQAMQSGASVTFQGIYRHERGGFTVALIGGLLTNAPAGPSLGNGAPVAKDFTIEFERIDTDYILS